MKINLLIGGYGYCIKFIEEVLKSKEERKVIKVETDNFNDIKRYIKSPLNFNSKKIYEDIYILKIKNIDNFIREYKKKEIDEKNIFNYIFLIYENNIEKKKIREIKKTNINIIFIEETEDYKKLKEKVLKYLYVKDKVKGWEIINLNCYNDYYKIERELNKIELYSKSINKKLSISDLYNLYDININYSLITKYFKNKKTLIGLNTLELLDINTLYVLIYNKDRGSIIKKDLYKKFEESNSFKEKEIISKKIIEIIKLENKLDRSYKKYKKGITEIYLYLFYLINK